MGAFHCLLALRHFSLSQKSDAWGQSRGYTRRHLRICSRNNLHGPYPPPPRFQQKVYVDDVWHEQLGSSRALCGRPNCNCSRLSGGTYWRRTRGAYGALAHAERRWRKSTMAHTSKPWPGRTYTSAKASRIKVGRTAPAQKTPSKTSANPVWQSLLKHH